MPNNLKEQPRREMHTNNVCVKKDSIRDRIALFANQNRTKKHINRKHTVLIIYAMYLQNQNHRVHNRISRLNIRTLTGRDGHE